MNNNQQPQVPPGMLSRVIHGKNNIIAYYEKLHAMTSDNHAIGIVGGIIQDEMSHLDLFISLYNRLFGEKLDLSGSMLPIINSFIDGVKFSILNELNMYSFYGNVFFTDQNEDVRNIFLRALFDESSHSIKLNYIYTRLLESSSSRNMILTI